MNRKTDGGLVSGLWDAIKYSMIANREAKELVRAETRQKDAETEEIKARTEYLKAETEIALAQARLTNSEARKVEAQLGTRESAGRLNGAAPRRPAIADQRKDGAPKKTLGVHVTGDSPASVAEASKAKQRSDWL